MDLEALNKIATAMVAPGKGILAADESSGTIKKRFDSIGVESTENNRRDYREMLFRTEQAMRDHISGVILGWTVCASVLRSITSLARVSPNGAP